MTREQAKQVLVDIVNQSQGIKAVNLASDAGRRLLGFDVSELIKELVLEKKIVEVNYILPDMQDRIKSFYLPEGTIIQCRAGNVDLIWD